MTKFFSRNTRAAKVTAAIVLEIRKKYQEYGMTQADLSREYRLSTVQIGRIVRGESWQNVPMLAPTSEDLRSQAERAYNTVQKEVELTGPIQPAGEVVNERAAAAQAAVDAALSKNPMTAEKIKQLAAAQALEEARKRGSVVGKIMGADADKALDELKEKKE